MLANEIPVKRISNFVGFHKSSIYREIARNSKYSPRGNIYDARFADKLCKLRHRLKEKKAHLTKAVQRRITWLVKRYWSPEQIANVCKQRNVGIVSTEAIYQYLYLLKRSGTDLCKYLPRNHKKRRKRQNKNHSRS